MDENQLHFRTFIVLCQKNNIAVCADPNLMCDKGTNGLWNGTNLIFVYRPNLKLFVILPNDLHERITTFINQSPNINWEMAFLLHEYGHWYFKHPHLSFVGSTMGYQHEVEAWNKGEEIGRSIGIKDFSVFYIERDKALLGYQVGLGLESRTE